MDLSALRKTPPMVSARSEKRVSRIFTVESQHLVFSNGAEADYERIRSGRGAVMCVPFDGESFILAVEYAAGLERYDLSFVKGKIDEHEDCRAAAERELQEEIGMGARNFELLKDELTVAPGMLELKMYVYLCTGLYQSKLEGDEPEQIDCVHVSINEAKDLIFKKDSVLTESRSIAALTLALHRLGHLGS